MLVHYLQKEFQRRKAHNPRYSLRLYAKSLKLDPSTLTKILNRSRKVTTNQALKFVRELQVDSAIKSALLLAVIEGKTRPLTDDPDLTYITSETAALGYWEFYAVLSLLELPPNRHTAASIAQRLNSTVARVSECLKVLEDYRFIRRKEKFWEIQIGQVAMRPSPGSGMIRQAQKEYLEKSIAALEQPIAMRDHSGSTIAISAEKLPEAWRRMKEFRRSLTDFLQDGEKDAVYRLHTHLFRLDRLDSKLT